MFTKKNWKTKFLILSIGQAVSMLGSHGVQFALIWWLAEKTSSPFMLGMAGLVAYLPMAVLSPLAGVAADKYNRKYISIIADLSMGLIALVYAILLLQYDLPVWTVLIMLAARGIGETFQQPAIQSIIPQLVPREHLVKAGGVMQLLNAGSFLIGPVIGATLYAVFPMSVVLVSDIVGAIFASTALALVPVPKLEKNQDEQGSFWINFQEGLTVFRQDSKLLYLVIAEALCMFFYAPLSSFYPLMTSDYFHLSAMYGSAVELSFAIGMIASSLLFTSVVKVTHPIRVSYVGLLVMGAAAMIGGIIPPVYSGWFLFVFACIMLGAGSNIHTIPLNAYIQTNIEQNKMGRAFSVLSIISSVTMPVGLLITSPIAEMIGVNTWFFISGICMLLLTISVGVISLHKTSA